jgi:hypothetical protein
MALPTSRTIIIAIALQTTCFAACAAPQAQSVSAELAQLYADDQAVRSGAQEAAVDWQARARQDQQRYQRVKGILAACELSTGADFLHAAMVAQHGSTPQDALLAHELAVIAASKGDARGPALAAKGLDRYLRRIGALQRFGTQSSQTNNGPVTREPGNPDVPAALFGVFGLPAPSPVHVATDKKANKELARLAAEANVDFNVSDPTKVDWAAVDRRKSARFARAKALLAAGMVRSVEDFSHAAALLAQKASEPDDLLLAHDLAVAAVIKGDAQALPLAAQSMDKYLVRTDRPQRFGTEIVNTWPNPPGLGPVDPSAFDCVRTAFGVRTLEESRRNVAALAAGPAKP